MSHTQVSQVQCVPVEMLNNCRFTYLEHSQPVCLEDLGGATGGLVGALQGTEGDWTTYMNACVSALFKEARDRQVQTLVLVLFRTLVQ